MGCRYHRRRLSFLGHGGSLPAPTYFSSVDNLREATVTRSGLRSPSSLGMEVVSISAHPGVWNVMKLMSRHEIYILNLYLLISFFPTDILKSSSFDLSRISRGADEPEMSFCLWGDTVTSD